MITISRETRLVLVLVAAADMMLFSRITILPFISIAVGAIMILLGIEYSYRPASVVGLLVMSVTAAASIEISTMLELANVLTALVGIFLPVSTLTWLALSAEEGENQQVSIMKKPGIIALAYALVCVWSAPLTILVTALFVPTISMRMAVMTEIAIILIATIAGGVLLMRKKPAALRVASSEEPAG